MLKEHCEEAARLLCAARGGAPVHELPLNCRPQSDADAYEIQEAVVRQLGETIGGWKVGAASAASAAFCAPIWMKMIRPSPRHKRREQGEQNRGYPSTISCHLVFAAPLGVQPHPVGSVIFPENGRQPFIAGDQFKFSDGRFYFLKKVICLLSFHSFNVTGTGQLARHFRTSK